MPTSQESIQPAQPTAPGPPDPISFSLVENEYGPLGKCFSLKDDQLAVETNAFLTKGRVMQQTAESLADFMNQRSGLSAHQALMMGQPTCPEASIVTQRILVSIPPGRRATERVIARDGDHMSWFNGPATVMLDIDNPQDLPTDIAARLPNTPDAWRDLLIEIFPALEGSPMAWAPSSSSYVYVDEEEVQGLRGQSGQRFYLVLESGLDTPLFKTTLRNHSY